MATFWTSTLLLPLLIYLVVQICVFIRHLKRVSYLPGLRPPFAYFSALGSLIPANVFHPGLDWPWRWRRTIYEYYRSDTISHVPFFGDPIICTRSIDVAKQILSGKGFVKAASSLPSLLLWGDSLITTNHDAYKKHRRVVGPAFHSRTYLLAAQGTTSLYHEMIESEGWLNRSSITLDAVDHILTKFTLGIISRCGFGLPFPWAQPPEDDGMPFETALTNVCEGIIIRLVAPEWAYKLPIQRLKDTGEAYRRLGVLMRSFVAEKKIDLASSTTDVTAANDLFSRLVSASESEGKNGLTDQELIGNIFAFLFAGQETTAYITTATLAMLAVYEQEQERVVRSIHKALPDDRDPTFEDFNSLNKVLACFLEAGRMFPAGAIVTRDTVETVVLKLPNNDGSEIPLVVPPGMRFLVDMIGIHYNPRHFPDPERYDPSRWYSVQSEVDFTMFGFGPRACIGRKFALTVSVCLLTCLLRDWKFSIPLKEGETKEMWRARVLDAHLVGMAFGVNNVPLTMTRRSKS